MKKLLIFSNLITLSVLGMLVVKGCAQPDAPEEAPGSTSNLRGTQVVLDYANTKGFKSMSIPQAMILKKNYMEGQRLASRKASTTLSRFSASAFLCWDVSVAAWCLSS